MHIVDIFKIINTHTGNVQQLTISQLIDLLPDCDKRVYGFDKRKNDYIGLCDVISYRGYYSELSIEYAIDDNIVTSLELKEKLKNSIGKDFTGYKGGEYTMKEDTFVWVSEYGESSGNAIVNAIEKDDGIYILTLKEDNIDRW